jgi:phosphodiesterase/alkaline phosphatase D-like protein
MWEKLAANVSTIDCILHMGDQVYGDDDFKAEGKTPEELEKMGDPKSSCWGQSKELVNAPGVDKNWEPLREQVKEIYSGIYRQTWSYPACASALAGVSNLMMLDDHEITDDTGDVPEHCDRSTWEYFVMTCAYQVYRAYQAQLNYSVDDVNDFEQKAYWHTELYPGIGVFFLDVRLERSLLRHQLEEMNWENHNYIGPRQYDELKSVMDGSFKDLKTVLLVSPTPPLFVSSAAASLIELKSDDVVGSWSNKKFKAEHTELLQILTDWQNGRPDRAVVMCAGDIHVGGFSDVQLDGGGPLINQVISSAIGNLPEASIAALNAVGSAVLAVAGLQTSMRINHTSWVFEANYGVLHISPPSMTSLDKERPTIKGEIVSKEAVSVHEFQYTIPGGLCGEALHGCQCTTS